MPACVKKEKDLAGYAMCSGLAMANTPPIATVLMWFSRTTVCVMSLSLVLFYGDALYFSLAKTTVDAVAHLERNGREGLARTTHKGVNLIGL